MGDLISRKALIKAMEKKYDIAEATGMYPTGLSEAFIITERIINEQATAYDVGKVTKQIKRLERYSFSNLVKLPEVIEIVKGAVKDE
jgi:hypothetical protein